jgi:hypothetical protein
MKPDAVIKVRFKTPWQKGRQGAVVGEVYGCPLFVDGEAFDCRIYLEGKTLDLGKTCEVGVKFLNPQLALPQLSPGKSIYLWEGREIATGKVVRLGA